MPLVFSGCRTVRTAGGNGFTGVQSGGVWAEVWSCVRRLAAGLPGPGFVTCEARVATSRDQESRVADDSFLQHRLSQRLRFV